MGGEHCGRGTLESKQEGATGSERKRERVRVERKREERGP